jgi:Na+/proline symporter
MGRNSIIQLIVAIIFLGLFLISWLVFGNIKTTDWVSLIVGVLFLIAFFLGLKKNKGNKQ